VLSKKITFQIVSPAGNPTGGVELLHQMAHVLLSQGYNVNIMYWPPNQKHELVEFYQEYLKDIIIYDKILDREDVIIILPEVFSYFIKKIKNAKILFWWLSVDNYINSKKIRFAIGNKFLPYSYWNVKQSSRIYHAVQSEYAKIYLSKYNVDTDFFISDYINAEYFSDYAVDANSLPKNRKNVILYNPAKGGEEQKKLISYLEDSFECKPLKGMDKQTMIKTLGESKVYIDFGEHPGKDRIPREAASLGCCIITNKKGSAHNSVDIPISDGYKFDQLDDYFKKVRTKIEEIFDNFERCSLEFVGYRSKIASEKNLFVDQVKEFAKKNSNEK